MDDSAELDRVFQSGHAPTVASLRSPSTASSSSRPNTPMSPRPKLSDALSHVAFSPKRPPRRPASPMVQNAGATKPRTVPSRQQPTAKPSTRHRVATVESDEDEDRAPTARTRAKASSQSFIGQSLSYAQPEVNVVPPTPPGADPDVKFTKMADRLERQAALDQRRDIRDIHGRDIPAVAQSTVRERRTTKSTRVPLRSAMVEAHEVHAPAPKTAGLRTPYKYGKLCLPDITGITSAVDSPMKVGLEYMTYDAKEDREIDGKLYQPV